MMMDADLECSSLPSMYQSKEGGESRVLAFPLCSWRKLSKWHIEPKTVEWGGRSIVTAFPYLALSYYELEFSLLWAWLPYWKMEQFRKSRLISSSKGKSLTQIGGRTGVLVYQCGLL